MLGDRSKAISISKAGRPTWSIFPISSSLLSIAARFCRAPMTNWSTCWIPFSSLAWVDGLSVARRWKSTAGNFVRSAVWRSIPKRRGSASARGWSSPALSWRRAKVCTRSWRSARRKRSSNPADSISRSPISSGLSFCKRAMKCSNLLETPARDVNIQPISAVRDGRVVWRPSLLTGSRRSRRHRPMGRARGWG